MPEIFVISDTHFGHKNIIEYCERPFRDVYEMNEKLLDSWNEYISPRDKVYHLGDVYFPGGFGQEYWESFFSRLNGKKRLILGNHDNGKDKLLLQTFQKIEMWRMFPEKGLLLTHVPVHPSTLNEHPRRPGGLLNVHGHTHNNGEPNDHKKKYKCVCVEMIDYKPIHIDDLEKIAKERKS